MSCYPEIMRTRVVLLVLLAGPTAAGSPAAASAAAAAPTAAGLHLDPAPDGGVDVRDGGALVAHVPLKTPALRRGQPALREVTVDGHRLAELRVPIRGTAGEEIWLGELGARPPRLLWSGTTGPRDADGETSIGLEVSPDRVLEYQTAAGVTRCDGLPPRLFPRAYDFASGRFRPVVSPLPEPGVETLVAHRGDPAMPAGRPVGGFHFIAASTTRAAGSDARGLGAPVELDDGNPATAWSEGLGGDGRGEFLTARSSAGGYPVRGLRILPGDGASLQMFRARNRLRRFQVALGPAREQRFDVEIPEDPAADAAHFRDPYWIPLPKPLPADCLSVIVSAVYPGSEAAPPKSYGTTAIGDLAIFTDADGPEGAERLVNDLWRSPDCGARLPIVIGLGAAAVLPTAQAVLVAKGSGRECLVEALTALEPAPKSPIVIEALTAALGGASDKEERLVAAAFAHAAPPPVAPLAQLLASANATVEDRARAARVLGGLDDEQAATALLAGIGLGPPALRAALVDAFGRAPRARAENLLAAIAGGPRDGGPREADLLRALPAAVKRAPERRGDAVTALRGALGPERAFEVRARAIAGLGALGAAGDPAALADLRAHSDDPVLRYLAMRELAGLAGAAAPAPTAPAVPFDLGTVLHAALSDRDPRVRETAALALGKRRDGAAQGTLIDAAKQEPWPFVRRAELEALGYLCSPQSGDLMIRAVARDVDEVRRAALVSLARCKDSRARLVLLKTLARRTESATLRELAAALLGESGDRSATRLLGEALRRLVVEAEADMALEGVAATALRALARLGGPDAVEAAVTLAADTRHPYRTTAIDALGLLCDPDRGHAALQAFVGGADPALAAAAENADRRGGTQK
jgi:HEAT repeat protein